MTELSGRAALVTGAGGGIGAAVSRALAASGARVLVTDLDAEAAQAVAGSIRESGGIAESYGFDVREATGAREAAGRAAALGEGTLSILINNAGAISPAMFSKMEEEQFRRIVDIHLVGSFVCSKAALEYLPTDGSGRIINVTSAAGIDGTIGQVNYAAAKAGIIGLTKSLARELARKAITVNAIAPLAATAMTESIRNNEKLSELTLARIPLGRWAAPEEIAATFVFFASDGAAYITGQVLPVDGGTVM